MCIDTLVHVGQETIMKNKSFLKVVLTFIGGPAAGAFGLWLLSEAPMVHAAICMAGVN